MKPPILKFSKEKFWQKCNLIKELSGVYNISSLIAVKSCPINELLAIAMKETIGFDASNVAELERVFGLFDVLPNKPNSKVRISITGPFIAGIAEFLNKHPLSRRYLQFCDVSVDFDSFCQYREFSHLLPCNIAIGARLNWAPQVSGVEGTRFGLDPKDLTSLEAIASDSRFIGYHGHNFHREKGIDSYLQFISLCTELSAQVGYCHRSVNFGGGVPPHYLTRPEELMAALRQGAGDAIELIIEPGRFWTFDSGLAIGTVVDIKPMLQRDGYFIITNLSKTCHLRWEEPHFQLASQESSEGGDSTVVIFAGPTCYEMDILGAYAMRQRRGVSTPFAIGDEVLFSNISGYAVGWNTSFNGVPEAEILCI
jgi:diaminopimelate decarboxylase